MKSCPRRRRRCRSVFDFSWGREGRAAAAFIYWAICSVESSHVPTDLPVKPAVMDAPAGIIHDGSRVQIQGLQSMPEAEHNGKCGVIRGAFHSTSTGCWPVQVEDHSKLLLAIRPENLSLTKLQRKCEPRHFSHLVRDGTVTLLGFGSLVSQSSASRSFAFKNFRIGSITGYQRIFNRSDWINYTWGHSRVETGETSSLALVRTGSSVVSRVALMDVSAGEGLLGFLHRETTYDIYEVRFPSMLPRLCL
jgi:hypothetical protein